MKKVIIALLTLIPGLINAQNNKLIVDYTQCQDATIDLANGVNTNNWGSQEETGIFAWTSSGKPVTGRTLIWFDLSAFSAAQINKATLHLYTPLTPGFVPQGNQGENTFQVFRVTSPWNENTVTWGTAPTYDASTPVTHAAVSTQFDIEITTDVTSLIKVMAQNNTSNYGLYIRLVNETTYRSVAIASREHHDLNIRPWLEIELKQTSTGINEPELAFSDLNTYQSSPGSLHCSFTPAENGLASITLYTLNGQQLLEQRTDVMQDTPFHTEFNTSTLSPGIYFMRVVQNNHARSIKFVISN